MSDIRLFVNTTTATVGAYFCSLIGGCDKTLKALAVLIAIDYITGIIKAYKQNNLTSKIGTDGILKKCAIFLVIIVANIVDNTMLATGEAFRLIVIMFYISNESLSILENLGALGVKMPSVLAKRIKDLNDDDKE